MFQKFLTFTLLIITLSACAQVEPVQPQPGTSYPAPDQLLVATQPAGYPEPTDSKATDSSSSNGTPSPAVASPYPGPETQTNFVPLPEDAGLTRGNVYLLPEGINITVTESDPVQATLNLTGTLPNPCYHLRVVVNPPDGQNQIKIEVYSVANPDAVCADMLKDFAAQIPMGSYAKGHYKVYINDQMVGEYDW